MIKSPFNFIPLADKLFLQDLEKCVSQDIPFSDSVSGTINLTVTAKSPLFIRNGHTKEDAEIGKDAAFRAFGNRDNEQLISEAMQMPYNQFCNVDGCFFIPSTSLKGEVRNILEIMSFSRMKVDINSKFAQREWYTINRWTPESFKKWYEKLYPIRSNQSQLRCGYLRRSQKSGDFEIMDCGKPYRIGLDKIDDYLFDHYSRRNVFKQYFSNIRNDRVFDFDINNKYTLDGHEFDPKTATFKYHIVGDAELNGLSFAIDDSSTEYGTRLKVSGNGDIKGNIVFTGQPGYCSWNRPKTLTPDAGKFYEFVFGDEVGTSYPVSEQDYMHFKFIYGESKEWDRVKSLLDTTQGVPVFFRKEKGKNTIKDFGLAYLYKLPYELSPFDILNNEYHKQEDFFDMAQCIFGDVETNKKEKTPKKELKGRVWFSNAFSNNAQYYRDPDGKYGIRLILNSPKASYYPIYIQQDGNHHQIAGEYKTYNDGKLAGWKRYVLRQNDEIWPNCTNSNSTDSILFPLQAETTFEGKIYFHNLRPFELGALLSALTFHSTEGCFHQLGQGKPYGLGKTKYDVELHCDHDCSAEYYMALFEEIMSKKFGNWLTSPTIASLITMAKEQVPVSDDAFKYMILQVNPNRNDFETAKISKEYLADFRTLQGIVHNPNSLLSHIATYKQEQKMKEEAKQNELKKQELDKLREWCESIMANITKMDDSDLKTIEHAINELRRPSDLISLEEKQDLFEQLEDKKKTVEDTIRSREKINAVARGLAADISKVSSLGNLQGHVKKWLRNVKEVEGRESLTSVEIEAIRHALKRLPSKELKKGARRECSIWKEFAAIIGEDAVNSFYSELYK